VGQKGLKHRDWPMQTAWVSWALLVLAYTTYGQLLHQAEASATVWCVSLAFILIKASIFTLLWHPARRLMLLGFKSDVGYLVMVLVLASLTVLVMVQFRAFAYIVVLLATAMLVRVDCLIQQRSDRWTFLVLLGLPFVGLGLTWLPDVVRGGVNFGP
jgi:hypothetical protein